MSISSFNIVFFYCYLSSCELHINITNILSMLIQKQTGFIEPEFRLWGHTLMTSTRKRGRGVGVVFQFVTCLRILYFLNNRSIVHFCGRGGLGEGESLNWLNFCGRHKCMTR